jgi:superfamily II DNA or RNA helicase
MGEFSGLEAELSALLAQFGGDTSVDGSPGGFNATAVAEAAPARRAAASIHPGSPWHVERGRTRWRLSAGARTLTRMSDGRNLSALVGAATAAATVSAFLSIRPSGGRVFVDDEGNATTLVDGALLYLGTLSQGGVAANTSSTSGSLKHLVTDVLRDAPGSTAREIAYEARRGGRSAGKSEINSLLYRDKLSFGNDGGSVPRWRLRDPVPHRSGTDLVEFSTAPVRAARRSPSKRGALAELLEVPSAGRPMVVHARASAEARPAPMPVLDLLAWQREAIARWYANGCHGIVEAVTGTGKTHVGLETVAHAAREGEKSTVLVPSVDLQDQWAERFARFLPHLSVARLGGRKVGDPRVADVTIAVVNSALRTDLSSLSPDSLLVSDEVHRYGAEQFQYALRANYRRRLGLTATLERSGDDAVEAVLAPYFGGSIMQVTFDRAIREEVVAPFRLVMAPVALNDDEKAEYDKLSRQISNGLKVLRGRGMLKASGAALAQELGRLRNIPGEVGKAARAAETGMRQRRKFLASASGKLDAIEELSEMIGQSQGTVVFTQSKGVAEEAALRLREWAVPASALHSDMNARERRASLDGLATGHLQALAAPKLLDEGIDVPTVDLGIVMTASRSRRQMVQRLGRVIRKKDDGRPVDFVILYAEDTVEDPSSGVHEGFFDLVGEVATRKLDLELGWTANDLAPALPMAGSGTNLWN